jgi:hypothetical protein
LALGDNSLAAMSDAKILKSNDSFIFDSMISSAFLYWDAQSGKSLTLCFATTGEFYPGSQISVVSGGVSITEGSALSSALLGSAGNAASVSVTSASAVQICAADSSRKKLTFYTNADLWVGDASVAVGSRGIPVYAGYFEWPSQATLYAIAVGATATVTGNDTR